MTTKTFTARGLVWSDTTSYSRDDKDRVPTTYSCIIGSTGITITNGHIYHRPNFVMHCFTLGIDTRPIEALTHKDAAEIAFDFVQSRVEKLARDFKEASCTR